MSVSSPWVSPVKFKLTVFYLSVTYSLWSHQCVVLVMLTSPLSLNANLSLIGSYKRPTVIRVSVSWPTIDHGHNRFARTIADTALNEEIVQGVAGVGRGGHHNQVVCGGRGSPGGASTPGACWTPTPIITLPSVYSGLRCDTEDCRPTWGVEHSSWFVIKFLRFSTIYVPNWHPILMQSW